METAIIAALVAAIVSLIGVLVNYRISRETRKTQFDLRLTDSAIKSRENEFNKMDEFLAKAEEFRLKLHLISGLIKKGIEKDPLNSFPIKMLSEELTNLSSLYSALIEKWSIVKHTITSKESFFIAASMHEYNRYGAEIINYVHILSSDYKDKISIKFEEVIETLSELENVVKWIEKDTYNLYLSVLSEKQRLVIELLSLAPSQVTSTDTKSRATD